MFWLRGLPPKKWYHDALADWQAPDDQYEVYEWGCFAAEVVVEIPEGWLLATDASGGPNTADARLRRVGAAVVAMDSTTFEMKGAICCSVPGEQTVNRGELFAMLLAAARTRGAVTAVTDSKYVQKPCAEDEGAEHQSNHVDLWALLQQALAEREPMRIVKVASHRGAEEAKAEEIPWTWWFANHLADACAGWAAKRWAVAPSVVKEVKQLDLRARLVQRRLGAVIMTMPRRALQETAAKQEEAKAEEAAQEEDPPAQPPPQRKEEQQPPPQHDVQNAGKLLWCKRCRQGGTQLPPACWRNVEEGKEDAVDASHCMVKICMLNAEFHICMRCGRRAQRRVAQGLRRPCHAPTDAGKQALKAVEREELPRGVKAGPLP